jgi:peptide synthetase PhsA
VRATGLNSTETGLTRLFQLPAGAPVPARIPLGGPVPGVDADVAGDGRIVIRSRFVRPQMWTDHGRVDLTSPGTDGTPEFVTGDRGELDAYGNLVHLGRSDAMVKIRGFRVEPSEVEAALAKVDGVTEVGVVPYRASDGTELGAVVTTTGPEIEPTAIRRRAAELLPQPMVPTAVVVQGSLPRTLNGKLDRRALEAIVAAAVAAGEVAAPAAAGTDDTYQRLRAIWQKVLRTERISAEDDFFTLGGTSISALSVISRVRKEFGVPVRLAVLFETPTLAALAGAVDELMAGAR